MARTSSSSVVSVVLLVAAFAAAGAVSFPSFAHAADAKATSRRDTAAAGRAIDRGIGLLKKGEYAEALAAFLEARDLDPGPKATAMIGQAEQVLKRWADAELSYTEALRAADDAWIKRNRTGLERKLAEVRTNLGRLSFASEGVTARDAEVRVNGLLVGILPIKRTVSVPIGPTKIDIKAPGHEPFTRAVTVAPQETIRIEVRLEATPPPPGSGDPNAPDGAQAGAPLPLPKDDERSGGRLSPWWGAGLGAAGAAGVIGGFVYLSVSANQCSDGPECQDRWDPLGGKIAIGVGAAGVVAGGALLWYALSDHGTQVAFSFDGRELLLAGRW